MRHPIISQFAVPRHPSLRDFLAIHLSFLTSPPSKLPTSYEAGPLLQKVFALAAFLQPRSYSHRHYLIVRSGLKRPQTSYDEPFMAFKSSLHPLRCQRALERENVFQGLPAGFRKSPVNHLWEASQSSLADPQQSPGLHFCEGLSPRPSRSLPPWYTQLPAVHVSPQNSRSANYQPSHARSLGALRHTPGSLRELLF